jgi:hypothetical protein
MGRGDHFVEIVFERRNVPVIARFAPYDPLSSRRVQKVPRQETVGCRGRTGIEFFPNLGCVHRSVDNVRKVRIHRLTFVVKEKVGFEATGSEHVSVGKRAKQIGVRGKPFVEHRAPKSLGHQKTARRRLRQQTVQIKTGEPLDGLLKRSHYQNLEVPMDRTPRQQKQSQLKRFTHLPTAGQRVFIGNEIALKKRLPMKMLRQVNRFAFV